MAAKTYGDVINKVMEKLREEAVTSLSDDYTLLIGAWVNTIKEEIEDSWNWQAGREVIEFETTVGQREYTLSGTNARARLVYEKNPAHGQLPMMFDTTDSSSDAGFRLIELTNTSRQSADLRFSTQTSAKPMYFSLTRSAANDSLKLAFRESPESTRQYGGVFYVPDDELNNLTDTIHVPFNVLVLGTLWIASAERGEELGLNTDLLFQTYQNRLAQAKALEMDEYDTLMIPV